MKVKDYKDMKVWQKGIDIIDLIYSIVAKFPKDEVHGLAAQMRRAAVSIPSNIAEGFVRHHSKEYKQFLYISLGSCAELETQVIISHRRGYITKEALEELTEDINHETRMLVSLINKIQRVTDHE